MASGHHQYVPQYVRIRDDIVARIESGELRTGEQIPSLREMRETYGVSSITARRALLDLINDGLVERRGGIGTFVKGSRRRARVAVILVGYSEESWRRNSDFGQLVGGIASAAWDAEAVLSAIPVPSADDVAEIVDQLIEDYSLDGILIRVAGDMDWSVLDICERHGVLVVMIKRSAPDKKAPVVLPDAYHAGLLATRHLLDLGHERIGLLAATASVDTYDEHRRGYEAALKAAGLGRKTQSVLTTPQALEQEGRGAAKEILAARNPPTAVVCNSDFLVLGLYEVAKTNGLNIPADLSIVGFDDMEFAAHLAPPLTTVRLPYFDLGRGAARALFNLLNGQDPTDLKPTPVELLVRESTAPPTGR